MEGGWVRWSVKWQGRLQGANGDLPLFKTRRECRAFIAEKYGYIKERSDLQSEPFNWRMPVAVKVQIVEVLT